METKAISDFGLMSLFTYYGYLPRERVKEGKRVSFIYEWNQDLTNLEEEWLLGEGDVGVLKNFYMTVKSVKQLIFQVA
jgi:hypothetical protein